MTSNQNTLLGALKSATTTIVTRPASPAPGHPQSQPPLERLTDPELKDLETIFNEDINFETDSDSEFQGTNYTLPLCEPPDREDWQQDLQKPKQKKNRPLMSSDNTVLATLATYAFGRTSPIFLLQQTQQPWQPMFLKIDL